MCWVGCVHPWRWCPLDGYGDGLVHPLRLYRVTDGVELVVVGWMLNLVVPVCVVDRGQSLVVQVRVTVS
jgi:hypothetical protein